MHTCTSKHDETGCNSKENQTAAHRADTVEMVAQCELGLPDTASTLAICAHNNSEFTRDDLMSQIGN